MYFSVQYKRIQSTIVNHNSITKSLRKSNFSYTLSTMSEFSIFYNFTEEP